MPVAGVGELKRGGPEPRTGAGPRLAISSRGSSFRARRAASLSPDFTVCPRRRRRCSSGPPSGVGCTGRGQRWNSVSWASRPGPTLCIGGAMDESGPS